MYPPIEDLLLLGRRPTLGRIEVAIKEAREFVCVRALSNVEDDLVPSAVKLVGLGP